jgi:hypothetical protein
MKKIIKVEIYFLQIEEDAVPLIKECMNGAAEETLKALSVVFERPIQGIVKTTVVDEAPMFVACNPANPGAPS